MSILLSCAEIRDLDRRACEELGMPTLLLMENAGRGIAELLLSLGMDGPVIICCGKGNNGGDGFVLARHLDNKRLPVRVWLFADPQGLQSDALVNYQVLVKSGFKVEVHAGPSLPLDSLRRQLATADWVVDALFGTGLKGPLRPPIDQLVQLINDSPARVLAVDIPSGLDGDTGQPLGATVRADRTATLGSWKKGFVEPAACEWMGQVHFVDIGLPRCLTQA